MLITKIYMIVLPMKVLLKHQKITEDNCCFMKSSFEYLNRMNLYFLISGKKQFLYLFSLSRFCELDLIQSLNFGISCFFLLNVK